MLPDRLPTVPLIRAETLCTHRSPRTNLPCSRAAGHGGRHAFIRYHIDPGKVREVWAATCQACGREVTPDEGAVCRSCGAA